MKSLRPVAASAALLMIGTLTGAYGDEAQSAQAMQFGMLIGGATWQLDACVRKGLLPARAVRAEEQLAQILNKSEHSTGDKAGHDDAMKGWALANQRVDGQTEHYWRSNCPRIAPQWKVYENMIGQGA